MAREMKDSGIEWIGEIPRKWEAQKLKHSLQWKSEKGKPNATVLSLYRDYGVVPKDSRDDNYNVTSLDTSNYKVVSKGDFVINKMKAWQGSMAVSNYDGIVSPAYHVCVITNPNIFLRYFHYLLRNQSYLPEYRRLSSGLRIGQWDLGFDDFKNIPFVIPPLQEQQAIADFLDTQCTHIDSVIEKTRAAIEEYKRLKQSIITQAVTKGIRPNREMKDSGIGWIGKIPEEWSISTIGRKIVFEGGSQPPLNQFIHEPKDGYVRLIQNRDYKTDAYITYVPEKSVSKFCNEKDVMIGRYGPPLFVMHRGIKGAYNVALMKAIPLDGIHQEWMYYILQEKTLLNYVESFSKRAAGQDGVNPKILKKYPLLIPSINEQLEIVAYLDEKTAAIDSLIQTKEQLITELEAYKKSLIYEYVTGKKEVV